MITTVIIEDETLAALRLKKLLSHFPDIELIHQISSVQEGIHYFQKEKHPDLIFSDIVLGDGTSFDIFEKIPTQSFIIYTTAFDQYTLRAFKLNSIDYLLKPFSLKELAQAIDKFKSFLPQHHLSPNFKNLLESPKISRLLVKAGHYLKILPIETVSCFFTEHKIIYAKTSDRDYAVDFSLGELEQNLNPRLFFRISRQYIISLNHIKTIHTSPSYAVELLSMQKKIPISRDRVYRFKQWLNDTRTNH